MRTPRPVVDARRALEFLAQASGVLAGSLDYERTLRATATLAVPDLADWCAIDVVQPDGSLRQITSVHPEPDQEAFLLELRRRYRAEKQGSEGVARVVRTGEPELVSDVAGLAAIELREGESELYRRLAPRSYIIVPLVARGRTMGALTLLSTREGRHYTEADLDFAQHLARRFALAVDNARLYDEAERSRGLLGAMLERERAGRRRATFLARAGEILESSLDYETTLRNVTRIAVPELADWCAIHMLDEAGEIKLVAVSHANPERERLAWDLDERFPLARDGTSGPAEVIRSGRAQTVASIGDDALRASASDDEHHELLHGLGLRSSIVAPLRARGRTLGAVTFVAAESARSFDEDDLALAQEVARRAGLVVDNARLYTERSRIAHALQAELLPARLPRIPGVQVAVRYRAAGELNEVGGDFYDVFERRDGGWAFVIGDVSGKGAEAAAVTALARHTVRTASLQPATPRELLETLNEALLIQRPGSEFCTVCVARLSPNGPGARLDLALGGHPPALVLRADGSVEPHGRPGTLLGVFRDPDLDEDGLELRPGDTLLLYTDGVTEAGPRGDELGEDGLTHVLAGLSGRSPDEVVDAVEQAAVDAQDGQPRDDIALIALRVED